MIVGHFSGEGFPRTAFSGEDEADMLGSSDATEWFCHLVEIEHTAIGLGVGRSYCVVCFLHGTRHHDMVSVTLS